MIILDHLGEPNITQVFFTNERVGWRVRMTERDVRMAAEVGVIPCLSMEGDLKMGSSPRHRMQFSGKDNKRILS